MKITRTITTKKGLAVALMEDGRIYEEEISFVGDSKKEEKKLAKTYNAKAVTIKDISESTLVYAMDVETFMENADEVRELSNETESVESLMSSAE